MRLKELIIQLHRYIGIPMSVIVVTWFASGIVMMYTRGMPALSIEQSLELKSAIPTEEIGITPIEALRRNDLSFVAGELSVEALLLRPAYRFGSDGELTIFADNGAFFAGADESSGRDIVATAFALPVSRVHFDGELTEPDQWTITENRHLPLLKYRLEDSSATEAYVSVTTGEIVLATNETSRFLAWIGAIPHWFYFTTLRVNQPAWYWTIVVLSTIGCIITALGVMLTFTQFRRSRPFDLKKSIHYRGLMCWHYLTGTFFGLLALTWLFSGLLSMDPFDWNSETGLVIDESAMNAGPVMPMDIDLDTVSSIPTSLSLKRLEIINVLGDIRIIAHNVDDENQRIVDASDADSPTPSGDIAEFISRLEQITGSSITETELLKNYDSYYYDRDHLRPLPVLRVSFDDAHETWAYIDMATGRIVGRAHRLGRLNRWLFNGLHSLDFGFWYDRRPLWDIVVIVLSIGGLATSGIGMWLGFARMRSWLDRRIS